MADEKPSTSGVCHGHRERERLRCPTATNHGCGFEVDSVRSKCRSVSLQRARGLEVPLAQGLCASTVLHLAAAPSIFRPRPGETRLGCPQMVRAPALSISLDLRWRRRGLGVPGRHPERARSRGHGAPVFHGTPFPPFFFLHEVRLRCSANEA